ncbi:MAG TPA: sigma-70 family RNA polymerase sigma factor, partial [Planctomycetota bacterium]|nr:sigma-70 family RNA polymerase sigma factor [Planctomycetota bacterium]
MRSLRTSELLAHRHFVRGLALSLTDDPESAEDLAQEALLIGLQRPPADEGALRAWLGQVVRRLAWRRFRSERARGDRELRARGEQRDEPLELPASYDAAQAETRLLLAQALDGLEPHYRDVLVLRFYEGLPPRDIAARLGLPIETVRTRLKRGLGRMRDKLEGRFGDREVWGLMLFALAGLPPRRAGAYGLAAAAAVTAFLLPALWWGLRAPQAVGASLLAGAP